MPVIQQQQFQQQLQQQQQQFQAQLLQQLQQQNQGLVAQMNGIAAQVNGLVVQVNTMQATLTRLPTMLYNANLPPAGHLRRPPGVAAHQALPTSASSLARLSGANANASIAHLGLQGLGNATLDEKRRAIGEYYGISV